MENMNNAAATDVVKVDFSAPVAPVNTPVAAPTYNKKHDIMVVGCTALGTVAVTLGLQWVFSKVKKSKNAKKAQAQAAAVNPVAEDEE